MKFGTTMPLSESDSHTPVRVRRQNRRRVITSSPDPTIRLNPSRYPHHPHFVPSPALQPGEELNPSPHLAPPAANPDPGNDDDPSEEEVDRAAKKYSTSVGCLTPWDGCAHRSRYSHSGIVRQDLSPETMKQLLRGEEPLVRQGLSCVCSPPLLVLATNNHSPR